MGVQPGQAELILRRVAEIWQVDADRVKWVKPEAYESPGFDWWPGDFCVRVRAVPAPKDAEVDATKITVRTDFLRDVAIETERFESTVASLARFSTSTYSWVYAPKSLLDKFPAIKTFFEKDQGVPANTMFHEETAADAREMVE